MRKRKLPIADLGGFGAGLESEGGRQEGAPLGGYGGWKGGRARDGGRGRRRQESEGVGDDTASHIPRQVSIEVPGRGIHVLNGVFGPSSSAPMSAATSPTATGPGVSAARSRESLREVPKARQLGFGRISGRPKLGRRVTAIVGGA